VIVSMQYAWVIRLCHYIVYFNHFNNHSHIGEATWRAGGLQPPCKRSRYSNRAVGNSNNRIIVKQVVYDEANKDSET